MKINKDGKLEIDILTLLESLSDDYKKEFIESLSCEEVIIKHVADQILTGWTENSYCGRTGFNVEPRTALELARAEVIKLAPEVAQQEIERLKRFAKQQEEFANKYRDDYFELYHRKNRSDSEDI